MTREIVFTPAGQHGDGYGKGHDPAQEEALILGVKPWSEVYRIVVIMEDLTPRPPQ
jgi:hypothetical protein